MGGLAAAAHYTYTSLPECEEMRLVGLPHWWPYPTIIMASLMTIYSNTDAFNPSSECHQSDIICSWGDLQPSPGGSVKKTECWPGIWMCLPEVVQSAAMVTVEICKINCHGNSRNLWKSATMLWVEIFTISTNWGPIVAIKGASTCQLVSFYLIG